MASRMRKRSSLSVASFERLTAFLAPTVASEASTVMIAITMTSSMRVQPPSGRRARRAQLPIDIFRSVEGDAAALGVDIVDVLAAPARRVRIVLIGAHAPLLAARQRIDRDAAEELQLAAAGVAGGADAFDQDLQGRRVSFRAGFEV